MSFTIWKSADINPTNVFCGMIYQIYSCKRSCKIFASFALRAQAYQFSGFTMSFTFCAQYLFMLSFGLLVRKISTKHFLWDDNAARGTEFC